MDQHVPIKSLKMRRPARGGPSDYLPLFFLAAVFLAGAFSLAFGFSALGLAAAFAGFFGFAFGLGSSSSSGSALALVSFFGAAFFAPLAGLSSAGASVSSLKSTNSRMHISAASPRRGPSLMMRV